MGNKAYAFIAATAAFLVAGPAVAQDWKPSEPVTIIVPWSAGGSTDTVTRVVAGELSEALGQNVVILNQPGASGSTGTRSVWEAPHDGMTMAAGAAIFHSLLTTMPELFEQRMTSLVGSSILGVGALVTVVFLGGAAAQIGGGILVDRYSIKAIYVTGLTIQIPVLVLVGQFIGAPLLVAAIAAVAVSSFIIPAENLMLARYTPAHRRGLAYGAKFVLAFGIAPLAVQLVGWTSTLPGGFAVLLWILAGLGTLALLAAFGLPNGRKIAAKAVPTVPAPAE